MKSHGAFLLLIGIVIITRIPLLGGGYGTDGDAWRVARTALTLWQEGEYEISRFPGFPLYELLQTPLISLGGSLLSNSASLFVFIFSLVLFRRVLRQWNVPHGDLVLLAYAFLPLLWKNSAVTMDYVWGLTAMLGALTVVEERKIIPAGIIMGLAVGVRISYLLFALPLVLAIPSAEKRRIPIYLSVVLLTGIVCYVPVLFSHDIAGYAGEFFSRSNNFSFGDTIQFFFYRLISSAGLIGSIGVGIVLLWKRRTIANHLRTQQGAVSAASIMTGLLLFAVAPDEREYIIPILPFLLIILAYSLSRLHFIILTVLLFSYSFFSIELFERRNGEPKVRFHVTEGIVLKEFIGRKKMEEQKQRLSHADFPDSSVVMIGLGPSFWLDNPSVVRDRAMEHRFRQDCSRAIEGRERFFIYALKKPQMEELGRSGFSIYYWDEMEFYFRTFVGYDLQHEHVRPLTLPSP